MVFIFALALLLGLGVFGIAALIYLASGAWYDWTHRHDANEEAPRPANTLRPCRGCNDIYHKSWGWMCPNCTGAD